MKSKNTRRSSGGDKADTFKSLTKESGLTLTNGHSPNVLNVSPAVFQRNLSKAVISSKGDSTKIVEKYMSGLQQFVENTKRFQQCIMPTDVEDDNCPSATSGKQDGLMRMLMKVEQIQSPLMMLLLDKLVEYTENDVSASDEDFDFVHFILEQFRFVDRIVNSKEIADKMLEIVSFADLSVQREIISCIPEVIGDADHTETGKKLRDIFIENNDLIGPVLDALSNMTLRGPVLSEIRRSVIETLPSANADCLPVIVKFLLQSVSASEALEVVSRMRCNLDFGISLNTKGHKRKSNERSAMLKQGSEVLTLEAIKSGIQFKKAVADAFIKAIEKVKHSSDHSVTDILILLVLHSTSYKKQVEGLVRAKLRTGQLTTTLLKNAFSTVDLLLEEYFPTLLSLAGTLLRSPEPEIGDFGCVMYKLAFSEFSSFCRQEIVCDLLAHISSGSRSEIESSLSVLADLVQKHSNRMGPYAVMVMSVLDYLETLTIVQIRQVYFMLSTLAYKCPPDGEMIQDELFILIKKQVSNNNTRYKKMGAVGAVMIIRCLGNSSGSGDSTISDKEYDLAVSLLQLVRTSCSSSSETVALFLDELANITASGSLDSKIEVWISDNAVNDFQEDFIVDIDEDLIGKTEGLPLDIVNGLDHDSEGSIAVNILPLLVKEKKKKSKKSSSHEISLQCMAPHFRLLQVCEKRQSNGDLEGIDALLGCPQYMPSKSLVDKMTSMSVTERNLMCEALFYELNWFREILNAFAGQTDAEMKTKIIMRLAHLTDVQKLLEKALAGTPNFQPPVANFYQGTVQVKPFVSSVDRKRKKPGAGKKKKKKDDKDNNNASDDQDETAIETQSEAMIVTQTETTLITQIGDTPAFCGKSFRPYLRELDMDVFKVLGYGLVKREAVDTEGKSQEASYEIKAQQLLFLLQNLSQKVDQAVTSLGTKRKAFPSKDTHNMNHAQALEIVKQTITLSPALCDHLEKADAYFQSQILENDGVLDGPGSDSEESIYMKACLEHVLKIILSVFSWSGLSRAENRGMLKKMLSILASSGDSNVSTQSSIAELIKCTFHYFEKIQSRIPTFSCAVTLSKLFDGLSERVDSPELAEKTGKTAISFLKRDWRDVKGEKLRGKTYNEQLQTLFKLSCNYSEDALSLLENIISIGVKELLDENKTESKTYPTLTKHSFPVYYRGMLSELVIFVKSVAASSVAAVDTEEKLEKLVQWNMAVRIFHMLINLIKIYDGRTNLVAALKSGRQFVELFLNHGMTLVDALVKRHREDVSGLLKNLQLSTRALHHVCGHSKIIKDVSLINQVPLMKRCLEAFVYRVKAMLTRNDCLEAFWLGNLKNRDLQGEELLSQASSRGSTQNQDDSSSDSVPSDEESDPENPTEHGSEATMEDGEGSWQESLSEAF